MALDAKAIKEEIPDKDLYAESQRRTNGSNKERCKTPDSPEGARLVAPRSPNSPSGPLNLLHNQCRTSNGSISPLQNGSGAGSPTPPPSGQLAAELQLYGQASQRPLLKVKRFLSTLVTFGQDISPDIGERVRGLVMSLASSGISIEEFQVSLQDVTNFPLRPFVLPFLRAHLPLLQREIQALARTAKQTPLQYVRGHEQVVLDPSHNAAEAAEIFLPPASSSSSGPCTDDRSSNTSAPILKRRASDAYHDAMSNGLSHDMLGEYPPPKRAHPSLLLNPSPLLMPVHQHQGPFDYQHFQPLAQSHEERRDPSNQIPNDQRNGTCDEWKNINTMLNCILSMVEKTKRALAILQQRGVPQETNAAMENGDIRRLVNEILSTTVRQTEERVAEVKRRAEDAVNQVKRQAVLELQRAVSHAESKALELVASERAKMEKILLVHKQPPDDNHLDNQENSRSPPVSSIAHQNVCWNCGRKANETCSGCNVARYCGSFCQHRDWETRHHQNCASQDTSKTALRLLPTINNTTIANPVPTVASGAISTSNGKCVLPSGNSTVNVSSVLCGNNNQERIPPLKK